MDDPFADLKSELTTVSAIPVTTYDVDGEIDVGAYRGIINRMIGAGITVITPNGGTGEFHSLSPTEHRATVEEAVNASPPSTLVLAGVGFDTETAVEMARFAFRSGARAVMVHAPLLPFLSAEGWIAYNSTVANAVPELGIVPYVKHAAVTGSIVAQLAEVCPNLVGVKYGLPNTNQFAVMVQDAGLDSRITWICGTAEMWAPFLWVCGASGFTSGLVNIAPELSLQMLHCLKKSDYNGAMQVWATIRPFEELRARHNDANNVPVIKEALAQLNLATRTVRPPITELPDSERLEVSEILRDWGVS